MNPFICICIAKPSQMATGRKKNVHLLHKQLATQSNNSFTFRFCFLLPWNTFENHLLNGRKMLRTMALWSLHDDDSHEIHRQIADWPPKPKLNSNFRGAFFGLISSACKSVFIILGPCCSALKIQHLSRVKRKFTLRNCLAQFIRWFLFSFNKNGWIVIASEIIRQIRKKALPQSNQLYEQKSDNFAIVSYQVAIVSIYVALIERLNSKKMKRKWSSVIYFTRRSYRCVCLGWFKCCRKTCRNIHNTNRHLVACNKLIVSEIATNVLKKKANTHAKANGRASAERDSKGERQKRKKWLIVSHLFGDYTTRTTSLSETHVCRAHNKKQTLSQCISSRFNLCVVVDLCFFSSSRFLFFLFRFVCDLFFHLFASSPFDWLMRRDHID